MRRWWIGFFAVLACALALALWVGNQADRIRQEGARRASETANRVIPEILRGWSTETLTQHASPELLRRVGRADVERTMQASRARLGDLRSVDTAEAEPAGFAMAGNRQLLAAAFRTRASFEKGDAVVRSVFVADGERWLLATFVIEDPPNEAKR